MAFSYFFCDGTNDQIDLIRAMIGDTVSAGHTWEDSEILGFYRIQGLQSQSSMKYSGVAYANLPTSPVSVLRVAASMLDAQANNAAKLAAVTKLLDFEGSAKEAAAIFHSQADALRTVDDESGAFIIIEQVKTVWDQGDRWWKQVQRTQAVA